MNRILFTFFLFLSSLCSFAQSLEDVSFEMNPTDLEAKIRPVMDNNGEPCALIRVVAPPHLKDLIFESSYIVKTEYRNFEYFVWMAEGAKKVTMKHQDFSPINKKFDLPLSKNITYVWTISAPEPEAPKYEVTIVTNAKNAEILVDSLSYGMTSIIQLEEGTHDVKVSADDYITENRQIHVTPTSTKFDIILTPVEKKYFSLNVKTNSKKSQLYVDGMLMGKCGTPVKIAEGKHTISVQTSTYKTIEQELYVTKDEVLEYELVKTGAAKVMNGIGVGALVGLGVVSTVLKEAK